MQGTCMKFLCSEKNVNTTKEEDVIGSEDELEIWLYRILFAKGSVLVVFTKTKEQN